MQLTLSDVWFEILKFYSQNPYDLRNIPINQIDIRNISLSNDIITLAISCKNEIYSLVEERLLLDAYNSDDLERVYHLIINVYSALKTINLLLRRSQKILQLSDELIPVAFRSFGYDYYHLIPPENRRMFLSSLVKFLQKKGTVNTLVSVLKLHGFEDISVYEWWLVRYYTHLYFYSYALVKGNTCNNYVIEYDRFLNLINYKNWYLSKSSVLNKFLEYESNKIYSLPSLTSFFSIEVNYSLSDLMFNMMLINRLINDQYRFYLSGISLPKDIYVNGYNDSVSLLALYCGILYCHFKYYDYLKFHALSNYIRSQFPAISLPTYDINTDYNYERLLLWCITRTDTNGYPQYLDILCLTYNDHDHLLDIYNNTNNVVHPGWLMPLRNIPFDFFAPSIELYEWNEWLNKNNQVLSNLNFDISKLLFDQQYVTNKLYRPLTWKENIYYIQDFTLGSVQYKLFEYNKSIFDISDYKNNILSFYNVYRSLSSGDYTSKERYDIIRKHFTIPIANHCLKNLKDSGRIISGAGRYINELPNMELADGYYFIVLNHVPHIYHCQNGVLLEISDSPDIILNRYPLSVDPQFYQWIKSNISQNINSIYNVFSSLLYTLDVFIKTYLINVPITLSQLFINEVQAEQINKVIEFWTPSNSLCVGFNYSIVINDIMMDQLYMGDKIDIDVYQSDVNGEYIFDNEQYRKLLPDEYL